jgi:hypothetical protein
VRAGWPVRGPDPEGGGFAAARLKERAAALWPGDAPRQGTGPPLSVKAGCDRGTTANRPAAWHMYTPSPALSAEPPAAPGGSKSGQAQPAPTRGGPCPQAPIARPYGMIVLTLEDDRICAITWFSDSSVFPHFGLPRTLPR